MSKMSELDTAVKELRKCGETLIAVSDTLRELFSTSAETPNLNDFVEIYHPETDDSQEEPPKVVTLEEVRSVLSSKSRAGFTKEVKALLKKHGADKLSGIKKEEYAALLKEGEKIGT